MDDLKFVFDAIKWLIGFISPFLVALLVGTISVIVFMRLLGSIALWLGKKLKTDIFPKAWDWTFGILLTIAALNTARDIKRWWKKP